MTKIPEIKEVYQITVCPRCESSIYEVDYDYDLNRFDVYSQLDEYIGSVYPDSIEDMQECHKALKRGGCPLCDEWEDGLGRILGHGVDKTKLP